MDTFFINMFDHDNYIIRKAIKTFLTRSCRKYVSEKSGVNQKYEDL